MKTPVSVQPIRGVVGVPSTASLMEIEMQGCGQGCHQVWLTPYHGYFPTLGRLFLRLESHWAN